MSTAAPRALLLIPAGVALLAGLNAGLHLLGLPAPVSSDRLGEVHGVLLVLGFVGTLISLERAVAWGRPSGYLVPGLLGAAALGLVGGLPLGIGQSLLVLGTAGLVGLYVPLWRRQRDDAVLVQTLGAVLALGAALLWRGGVPVPDLLPWLMGFVVLTIAGERLELARLAMGPGAGSVLLCLAGLLAAAVLAALLWPAAGSVLLGVALLGLTAWLARHDVARRTVHSTGQSRYAAVCLLLGYGWLSVAGLLWLVAGPITRGTPYDAVVHAVFLGFTLSMIFAHAPVILPAVLRRPLPYRPALWIPVLLLHASLLVRLGVGDARGIETAVRVGGALNVAAVLLFLGVAVGCAATAPRKVLR